MKTKFFVSFLCLLAASSALPAFSQTPIRGYVVDGDSDAVSLAKVRFPGLSREPLLTNARGYFEYRPSAQTVKDFFFKGGVDLFLTVEKEGMVPLDPPDGKIRLPHNANIQSPFRLVMVKKGSPLLARSERMLEYILRQKIQAAVEAKEQELARRDVLAEEAQRLGLAKETLLTAVAEYKDRLRTSTDLNLRGLAALDDANEATEYKLKQLKLDTAEVSFREAKHKDELAVREGEAAQKRLPEIYYNLGLTLFAKARYDSAAFYFAKADTNDADRLNMWGQALYHLAAYDKALQKFRRAYTLDSTAYGPNHSQVASRLNNIAAVLEAKGDYAGALEKYEEALKIDESYFGRNHPNVATRLNNIAGVLEAKGDYAGALEKYEEALKIFTQFLGPDHPNTKTVAANRLQAYFESLGETERWRLVSQIYLSRLSDTLSSSDRLGLLNQIGVGYIKQAKADSGLIYLQQALPLAQKLNEQEMLGTVLNNLGAAYKLKKDWPQARQWLEKSLSHNRKTQGDSAAVLAYTYFHLAGVAQAEGQTALSREHAQKSLALAERHKLTELRAEVEALLKQKR
jgi:tetratricopeptide (TPR) repeat protein